ncbi:GNAT family N-acetyltransferase [Allokutzneria albata]|uniref:Protein N-acetyltransferase, RimJ/RimL family n=1 Tax=Allokutzneria albata TaxID=211114 RepID=A0A1H0DKB5_ALLAB|nr:GNAT family N-acetyltransferase [Allokutzneria albata]SDN70610.1 Protein N-acetyltransferase, RimJ/RimL family [Allokutzneria albata]
MNVPELVTERMVLRELRASDAEAVAGIFADPEMSRWLGTDLSNREAAFVNVYSRVSGDYPDGMGHFLFTVDGAAVGIGHLRPSNELPGELAEIGWFVARPHWGTGLAREATEALLRHAFDDLALPTVWALVHPENTGSLKLSQRLGFLDVGERFAYGAVHRVQVAQRPQRTGLHHVELWVGDLDHARDTFGWLLTELGFRQYQLWENGISWRLGPTYIVAERSPARNSDVHDRLLPGLNHLALHAGDRATVDRLTEQSREHGWRLMFGDRHPHAGGEHHYAAYLENADGFQVELVAEPVEV